MKFIPSILLLFGLFAAHPVWAQIEPDSVQKEAFVIGEVVRLHSTILNEKRVLNIYLPESYGADSTKTYPVIYLLDGSRDEDFIHIAGLVQFCSFSWIGVIPESIVVGIGNSYSFYCCCFC